MKTVLFALVKFVFLVYLIGYFTHLEISRVNHSIRILLIAYLTIEIFNLIKHILGYKKTADIRKTLSISGLILFVFFLLLETTFMFIPRTHTFDLTHASRLWFKIYWKPTNPYGYRDNTIKHDSSKRTYFFVGDSFTAGFGIKKVRDRYSDLVAAGRPDVNVYNLGINAIDTELEFRYMENFIRNSSIKPDNIFLQYYGNDIDIAAMNNRINLKGFFTPYSDVPALLYPVIRSSYFLDYFYWLFPRNDSVNYRDFLEDAYSSEETLQDHYNDLARFVDFADENTAELVVILFPFLQSLESSEELYMRKIRGFFESKNIKILDVGMLVEGLPLSKTLVNKHDAHASVLVNRLIANEILKMGY